MKIWISLRKIIIKPTLTEIFFYRYDTKKRKSKQTNKQTNKQTTYTHTHTSAHTQTHIHEEKSKENPDISILVTIYIL